MEFGGSTRYNHDDIGCSCTPEIPDPDSTTLSITILTGRDLQCNLQPYFFCEQRIRHHACLQDTAVLYQLEL